MESENPSDDRSSTKAIIAFVLPFVLFMALGSIESYVAPTDLVSSWSQQDSTESAPKFEPDVDKQSKDYWIFVTARLVIVGAVIVYFWPVYLQHFRFKVSLWSLVVGVIGAVLWIGICNLQVERQLIDFFGLSPLWLGERTGFPATTANLPGWYLAGFLVCRFGLLVIVVPLAEELLVRGFLVRFLQDHDWGNVGYQGLSFVPLVAATVYGVLTHPTEIFAAIAWFSLVTILMVKTGNLWDCVVAHGVTNLLLGIYIVTYGHWYLW